VAVQRRLRSSSTRNADSTSRAARLIMLDGSGGVGSRAPIATDEGDDINEGVATDGLGVLDPDTRRREFIPRFERE
jgi:hypothetical protein